LVKVHVTRMLMTHLGIEPEFSVQARTLQDLLVVIDGSHRGFMDSICDESGKVRPYVNIFLNGENVSHKPQALSTRLSEGDEVYILASVAGGDSSA